MSTKAYLVEPAKGNSTLVRPRYSAGLLLRDDDLSAGVDYTRNLSRLLFRSFFGCGVICGLKVGASVDACGRLIVTVDEGVALSCSGDPIQVPQQVSVTLDPCGGKPLPTKFWVTLCLTDRSCAPRASMCACDDTTSNVSTREIAGYEIRVLDQFDACACGCKPPAAASQAAGAGAASAPSTTAAASTGKGAAAVAQAASSVTFGAAPDCACADPCDPCQQDHYAGICGCNCCDSDCVMLAVVAQDANQAWKTDHSVRRFIRPVLMRDPQVVLDNGGTLCPAPAPAPTPAPAPVPAPPPPVIN